MPRTKTSAATTTKPETDPPKRTTSRRRSISDVVPASGERSVETEPSSRPRSTRAASREQIEQRAFELYLERGGAHGHHEEDWARAERELASGGG